MKIYSYSTYSQEECLVYFYYFPYSGMISSRANYLYIYVICSGHRHCPLDTVNLEAVPATKIISNFGIVKNNFMYI